MAIDSIQEEITWSIDNKYYSADVRFSFHSVEGGFPENISQHDGIVVIVPHGDDEVLCIAYL